MSNSPKNFNDLLKFIAPSDVLPITIVLVGVALAIFNETTAFRLIGVGASIIGLISLFLIISQRMGQYVETKHKSKAPAPNYNITTKRDTSATRQTFEDFADSMKEDDKKEIETSDAFIEQSEFNFRFVTKSSDTTIKNVTKPAVKEEVKNIAKASDDKIVIKIEQPRLVFGDEDDLPEMPANFIPPKKEHNEVKIAETKEVKEENKVIENKVEKAEEAQTPTKEVVSAKEEIPKKHKETRKIEGLSAEFLKQDPIGNLSDPKQEFEYCINRILNAIKSVGSIGTTALFMVNHSQNEFKLESFSTNMQADKISNKKKFAFRNDIISQIISNSKPEILSEINPNSELELIPYYVDKVGISSFIGVPIFYGEEIIGVLTADSEYADGFDAATVSYFSHFTRLIAILIHNYVEKYDLSQSQKTLEALNKFRVNNYSTNIDDIGIDLFNTAVDILSLSFAGIVLWDEEKGNWVLSHFVPDSNGNLTDLDIEIESIVNKSLEKDTPVYIKALKENEFLINRTENLPEFKKLVVIPVHCSNVTYASLIVASDNNDDLSDSDIESLEILCDYAGSAYERYHLINILNENSFVDRESGLYSNIAYRERIVEEFERAKEFDRDLSICLINIDKYAAYEDEKFVETMEILFYNTIKVISKHKRKFDIVAKDDNNFIAVIMPETKVENVKFWAEKLRNEIATNVINVGDRTLNATVSIGIASSRNSNDVNELVENVGMALSKSMEKNNSVTLFN